MSPFFALSLCNEAAESEDDDADECGNEDAADGDNTDNAGAEIDAGRRKGSAAFSDGYDDDAAGNEDNFFTESDNDDVAD